jgi:hypothetical protein
VEGIDMGFTAAQGAAALSAGQKASGIFSGPFSAVSNHRNTKRGLKQQQQQFEEEFGLERERFGLEQSRFDLERMIAMQSMQDQEAVRSWRTGFRNAALGLGAK